MANQNILKQRIAPGLWLDQNNDLHISVIELMAEMDLPDTEENRALVGEIGLALAKRLAHGKPVTIISASGRCPRCQHNRLTRDEGAIECQRCKWKGQIEHLLDYESKSV